MKTTIYDYDNKPCEIELQDKKIVNILVVLLSGDELIKVYYEDGSFEEFDSSDRRCDDFFDGVYLVTGNKLQEWLNWKPTMTSTYSYEREECFDKEDKLEKDSFVKMYGNQHWYLFTYFSKGNLNSILNIDSNLEHGNDMNEALEHFKHHTNYLSIISISDVTELKDPFDVFEEDE